MKKNIYAGLLVFLVALQIFQAPVYAEAGTGTIQAIKPLGNGAFEIIVNMGGKDTSYTVDDATEIRSQTSAEKIKAGSRIYVPSGKGIKPSLANISPLLKKELKLPDIPKMPEIPQIPKLPKEALEKPKELPMKKILGQKNEPQGAPPMPGGMGGPGAGGPGQAPREKPKAEEPKPEDKELFGPVDADKSLVNNKGEVDENIVAKKVLKVEKISGGIKLKLESAEGKTEETVVAPAKKILQRLSPADLQEKMKINIEMPGSGNAVKKITVIS